jgi:putative membrane protein
MAHPPEPQAAHDAGRRDATPQDPPGQDAAGPADYRGSLARRLFPDGETPDPRVSLANERTFLSWIRTGLALQAAGVAIEAFAVIPEPGRKAVAVLLLLLGMLVSGGAFVRWIGIERAVRLGQPLPLPLIAPVLGIGGAVGSVVVIYLLLR